MLPNSLRTRGVSFAFLVGPPRWLSREEASAVYNAVAEELHIDDLSFRYNVLASDEQPKSRGFAIVLERKEGRGLYRLALESTDATNAPMRLLLNYEWPSSNEHAKQTFDMSVKGVQRSLGPWQAVVAETRVRAQCAVQGENGLGYLVTEVMHVSPQWVESLGKPLAMATAKFEVAADATNDPLKSPKRDLTIEVLREEPQSLYLELSSQWTQFPSVDKLDMNKLRPIDRKPSEYVDESMNFLKSKITGLAQQTGVPNE